MPQQISNDQSTICERNEGKRKGLGVLVFVSLLKPNFSSSSLGVLLISFLGNIGMTTQTNNKPADMEADEELQEELAFGNQRGFCCWFPCFGSRSSDTVWERIASTPEEEETTGWTREWLGQGIKTCKKIREWSELVAGPKWKTFIRRFNKNRGGSKSGGKYHYDPLSYALNFDDGPAKNGLIIEDDDLIFRDFSSRYASIPMTVKSQVESGKGSASLT